MIPIPEGAESYSEESTQSSGYGESQETLDQPGDLVGSGGLPNNGMPRDGDDAGKEGLCELSGRIGMMPPLKGGVAKAEGVKMSSELEGWQP